MLYNDSPYEKWTEDHRQYLLRQAGQQRVLAHLPQYASGVMRAMAGRLAVCLIAAGTCLKQPGHMRMTKHVQATWLSSLGSPHH